RPDDHRAALYARCRPELPLAARQFWDDHPQLIAAGIGSAGKIERYFALFRNRVLPWGHSRGRVQRLLDGGTRERRQAFFESTWHSWRWRLLFRPFFSRLVMGRLGRDPAFFRCVEGSVAEPIAAR